MSHCSQWQTVAFVRCSRAISPYRNSHVAALVRSQAFNAAEMFRGCMLLWYVLTNDMFMSCCPGEMFRGFYFDVMFKGGVPFMCSQTVALRRDGRCSSKIFISERCCSMSMFAGCFPRDDTWLLQVLCLHASRLLLRLLLMLVVPSSCQQTVEMSPCLYVHRELLRRERYLIWSLCFNVFLSSMKFNCCNFSTSNPFYNMIHVNNHISSLFMISINL